MFNALKSTRLFCNANKSTGQPKESSQRQCSPVQHRHRYFSMIQHNTQRAKKPEVMAVISPQTHSLKSSFKSS